MRTVLALDEMLAHRVKRKLDGEVEAVDHVAMRELSKTGGLPAVVARLRELVTEKRSVLAIGGSKWDAMDLLRRLELPAKVPVVLVAPNPNPWGAYARQADDLRVRSLVFPDRSVVGPGIAEVIAGECVGAWKSRRPPKRVRIPYDPNAPLPGLEQA